MTSLMFDGTFYTNFGSSLHIFPCSAENFVPCRDTYKIRDMMYQHIEGKLPPTLKRTVPPPNYDVHAKKQAHNEVFPCIK